MVNLVQTSYDESSEAISDYVLDSWTDSQLKAFLDYHNIPNPTPRNRDSLLQTARNAYSNLASVGPSAYDTLFSQWTDSDLKAWCDEHGIPVPQGSTKESMLAGARRNTRTFLDQAKAKVAGIVNGASESMFDTWSESQLKEMFDENGIPVPQGSKLNEMRALARKNYKNLKNSASEYYAQGASSVSSAAGSAASDASTKAGKVGSAASKSAESAASVASKSAESAASVASKSAASAAAKGKKSAKSATDVAGKSAESMAAKAKASAESAASEASKTGGKMANSAKASAESAASEASKTAGKVGKDAKKSANSVYGEASKTGASAYNKATDAAASAASQASEYAVGSDNVLYKLWSDSRLKSFLDARGIPVPQNGKKDDLVALVRENSHKARIAAEDFEGWSSSELQKFAKDSKIKLNSAATTSRDELVRQTTKGYSELQKKGDAAYSTAQKQYESIKAYAYDTWSDSDLKSYLDSYGVSVPQSSTKDQLVAMARKNGHYFASGQTGPLGGSPLKQMAYDGIASLMDFVKKASGMAYGKVAEGADEVKADVKAEL